MRVVCALAAVLSLAASGVGVGAEPGPAPAGATATATAPLGPKKLFGGGNAGGGLLSNGNKAAKPLLPSAGKPTPASLALQRLQHLAANALRDRGYTDMAEVTVGNDQKLGRWGRLAPLSSSSSSMAGTDAAEGSSLVTLDLPKEPLAELANVVDLYQSIFGITPDFSNVNDTRSFYQRVQDIILSSAPAISFDCQPSFRIWPKEINFAFPDQHSAVHFFVLPSFGPNDLVMIEGYFPAARYFSFETLDASLKLVSYLCDVDIRPLGNVSNPFSSVLGDEGRTEQALYRLYLTKDGSRGFPNELAAANRNFALRGQVVVLLRLYGIDPRADVSQPELEPWGYVPPTRVSARVLGTISPTSTDLVWETYPECPANNTLVVRDALTAITNLAKMVDTRQRSCPSENVADNFMLVRPDQGLASSRTPFANTQDASFLLACANHRPSYRKSNDLVAVVHAHLPLTPVGLADAPFVGDPSTYDVRYASFSVADLNPPGPVVRTIADDEFRAFYHQLYGPMQWEALYGRNVSLVVARNRAVLERCGVDVSESFVVELEDQTPMSDWFGVIYRELLPQGVLLQEEQEEDGGKVALPAAPFNQRVSGVSTPRLAGRQQQQQQQQQRPGPRRPSSSTSTRMPYAEAIFDAERVVCADEEVGGECDANPYRVATVMKGHFPRVHYYFCSQLGNLSPAPPGPDPFAGKGYPKLKDEVDGSGPWPAVPTFLEFCNTTGRNEGLIRVFSPHNWLHIYYRDPKAPAASAMSVKVVAPGTVGTMAFPMDAKSETVAVGVSVKATSAAQAPFLAEVELCGSAFPADPHWRCYNEPPVDAEGWLLPAFEDARWRPAAWASRGSGVVVEALRPAFAAQFGRDARRFVLPAPSLDQEAEKAWNAWESAKESANAAWKKWRAAVDAEKQKNGTAADAVYATSMRGGDPGYNATDSTTSAQSQSNNNTSLKWEDHAPNTTLKRLEWHKPIPSTLHSYFCRIELPNPALAYALEMQQGLGSTKLKKGGASA